MESAKALHEFAEAQRKEAGDAAAAASRAARSAAYARGGIPQGNGAPTGRDRDADAAQNAVDRINAMKAESGKNGDKRDASKIMTVEDTLVAMGESGKTQRLADIMTGDAVIQAASAGAADGRSAVQRAEDARG